MATNFNIRKAILAFALIFLLAPIPILGADFTSREPECGPTKIFLSSTGCQNCLKPGNGRPTCAIPCDMSLTAVVQNTSQHHAITVEVTMTVTFPWVPGPGRCGQGDIVRVDYVDMAPQTQATLDYGILFFGSFRGASYTVTTVVVAADEPDLIGKTEVESIPVRAFWPFCGD